MFLRELETSAAGCTHPVTQVPPRRVGIIRDERELRVPAGAPLPANGGDIYSITRVLGPV